MNMINFYVLVDEKDTKGDVINKICQETLSDADEPICFSAIYNREKRKLTLNVVEDSKYNVYSAKDLVSRLMLSKDKKAMFVQPPLELYLEVFKPVLEAFSYKFSYEYNCTREEVLSDLYYVIIDLRRKGYYLSKALIRNAYINFKRTQYNNDTFLRNTISLNCIMANDTDGGVLRTEDVLSNENELIDKDAKEFRQELYQAISEVMIEELGEFMFKRVLHQVATNTIDNMTSRILLKYRQRFNDKNVRQRKSSVKINDSRMEIKLLIKKGYN